MANKYLAMIGGMLREVMATVTSTGAEDAGKIVGLNAQGRLDDSVMPSGIGASTKIVSTSEALASGDFINLWDDAGTLKVRKADASATGKQADGFVKSAYASGANATIYTDGINDQCTGLSGGPVMYLSASTPGTATATAPSTGGGIVQRIGRRLSATEVAFDASDPIVLA